MDANGEHDQRCPHAFSLGRHDHVQHVLQRKLQAGGITVSKATVHELRGDSSEDRSQKKADLRCDGLSREGKMSILDVGITHPLIDTNLTLKSTVERGFAANQYGAKKERGYKKVMEEKMLDRDYHSFTLGSFGSFGKGTWNVINLACDPDTHPGAGGDYDPWMLPDPKRDFVISIGFALQRANARMVRDAHFRRRKNRAGERYASGVEVESDSPSSSE